MPLVEPPLRSPYPTLDHVLRLARVYTNDAAQTLDGNLLALTQPYTLEYVNSAWHKLQDELAEAGAPRLEREVILPQVPIASALDPAVQVSVSYTGSNDGALLWSSPILPQDLMEPMRLHERQAGMIGNFIPMKPAADGLPRVVQGQRLRWWDWKDDSLYFTGATQLNDLLLRYYAYLPEIPNDPKAQLGILRCQRAMGFYIAGEFAAARGSTAAADLMSKGDDAVQKMTIRIARVKQRLSRRRKPYGRVRGSASNY
jgi:hypothetical protein